LLNFALKLLLKNPRIVFAISGHLKTSPHLKHFATLRCKILMSAFLNTEIQKYVY